MKTGLFTLGNKDIVKGLIMALITSVVTAVYTSLQSGSFPKTSSEWRAISLTGISAALAYLMKNFLTNSDDQFGKKEQPKTDTPSLQ